MVIRRARNSAISRISARILNGLMRDRGRRRRLNIAGPAIFCRSTAERFPRVAPPRLLDRDDGATVGFYRRPRPNRTAPAHLRATLAMLSSSIPSTPLYQSRARRRATALKPASRKQHR
jgi:hypothetical protein